MLKKLHSIIATKIIEILGLNEQQAEEHIKEYGSLETYLFKCEKDDWYYEEINEDGITKKNWDQSIEKVNLFWECFLEYDVEKNDNVSKEEKEIIYKFNIDLTEEENEIILHLKKNTNYVFSCFVFPMLPQYDNNKKNITEKMVNNPIFIEAKFLDKVDFKNKIFKKLVNFRNVIFEEFLNFSGAKFCGDLVYFDFTAENLLLSVLFDNTIFKKGVSFNKALFKGFTTFYKSKFFSYLYYGDDVIKDVSIANFSEAEFSKGVSFENAEFLGRSDFSNAKFKDFETTGYHFLFFPFVASFYNATFEKIVFFNNTNYFGEVSFDNAKFEGVRDDVTGENFSAYFFNTVFKKCVRFENITFRAKLEFIGVNFLGKEDNRGEKYSVYFNGTLFKEIVSFKNIKFEEQIVFNDVTFERGLDFSETVFPNKIKFENTTFSGRMKLNKGENYSMSANFSHSTFLEEVTFNESKFLGGSCFYYVKFEKIVNFSNTTFKGYLEVLDEYSFSVDFHNSQFLAGANFSESKFLGYASFRNVIFLGETNFEAAKFLGYADFMKTTFSGKANFEAAIFTNKVNFKNCSFEKILTLKNISFTSKNKKTISKPISIFKKISTTLITSIYKDKTEKEDNSENKIIDFEYASINKLIIDNPLVDKDNHFYKDLTLGLHGATIEKIACDQEELLDVKLLSADTGNETTQEHFQIDESLEKNQKKIIMQGIHRSELTVLKDLASMLNMYEKEDEIHKKIMNNELAENISKQMPEKWYYFWEFFKPSFLQLILFDKIIFQYAFGWGIKLWNIFISTIVIISSFSIYYIITGLENIEKKDTIIAAINNPSDITLIENIARSFWISIVSFFGIFLPNYFDGVVGFRSTPEMIAVTESIIGLLWVTVFVAMLSRKFMRM